MGMRIMENMKKGKCEVCGWRPPPLYPSITQKLLNAHHVYHRSRGGPTDENNLLTLCPNHHAIAHALTGGGKTYDTSLLDPVTGEELLNIMRKIDADPDGWIRKRNEKVVKKLVRKSMLDIAPAPGVDTSPEGYIKLFSKLMSRRHMKSPVNPENLPDHIRARDLAILLDMSLDDVVEMARRGILKGYKRGKGWWFRREDVEQYFLGHQETE